MLGILRTISRCFDSAPKEADVVVPKDKTYQMDYANRLEAIKEAFGMLKKVIWSW
jgi:delta-aminolevulinic acid dehydratase/porphobilinogen synthase